jgi:methylated-DNA-protein-cysteine methyltransferase-like protein
LLRVSAYPRIWTIVCDIPPGSVATYGAIAELAGMPRAARQVGYAMAAVPEELDVPWHRVVNAQGKISKRRAECESRPRRLLEDEGVEFDTRGRIDLARFGWLH